VAPGSPVSIAAIEDYEEGLLRIRYTPTAGERATLRWLLPDGAVTGPMVNEFLGRAYGAGVSLQFEEERDGRISICVRAPLSEVVPTSPVATRVVEDGRWNRLVIADDNVPLRELMAVSLEGLFDEIHQVSDGLEVIERIAVCDGKVDLVLVDLRMPNRNGLEVLADLRARWPDVRCIVATGAAPDGFTQSALTAGARAVLAKPFRLHELRAVVRSVMAGAHW
jgi:CheY-like chemotaxis protein